jgi:putative ABC transport system permease protein
VAAVLALTLAATLGLLVVLGARNPVFVKLALRNVVRRRGRSALIVVGLMLATTMIAAALGTGDTMSATIRSSVFERLGPTDEVIGPAGAKPGAALGVDAMDAGGVAGVGTDAYLDEGLAERVAADAAASGLLDGASPAIVDTVAVQDTTRRSTEPRLTVFATPPERPPVLGGIRGSSGSTRSLGELAAGEVFLNRAAASTLGARAGDELRLSAGGETRPFRVLDVVSYRGGGTDGAGLLMGLIDAQALVGRPGQVRYVLLSNRGGEASGVARTSAVEAALGPQLAGLGLGIQAVKQDGLQVADDAGRTMLQMFGTFGSFSIFAGILLIFLIFVLLAAERRSEMGVARALGTQRGHLVQMFVFEGVSYDLAAAAGGAALGIAVAFVMVSVVARLVTNHSFAIVFTIRPASLAVAYALGVLLTLAVVTASAWRVSLLQVAAAIRNLPDARRRPHRRAGLVAVVAMVAVGGLLVASGRSRHQAMPFMLGASVLIMALVPLGRLARVPSRVAYTPWPAPCSSSGGCCPSGCWRSWHPNSGWTSRSGSSAGC